MLDKLICQWRESEEKVREDCGLDSVTTYYPGCTNYDRGHTPSPVDPETLAPIITPAPTPEPTTLAPITPAPTPAPVADTLAPITSEPITSAPITPGPTPPPMKRAAQPLYYASCNICGSESLRIVNETAVVRFPAFEVMTCRQFENAGLIGLILPEFCTIFPAFTHSCGCAEPGTRRLRSDRNTSPQNLEWPKLDTEERRMDLLKKVSEREEDEDKKQARLTALHHPVAESRMHHIKAGADNNEIVHEIDDDDEYFAAMMDRHLKNDNIIKDLAERERRRLVNYEDVSYWPYEWLMKVDTEYYFRYEGTQDVPPCKDQVHLRIMKDPIQVAQRQIDELERLMFERISPDDADFKRCEPDHAGAPRADTADKFDFVRPIQGFHKLHRKVFCECKDWKSKFAADKNWCTRSIIDRFYDRPYNFDTEEFFDTSGVF